MKRRAAGHRLLLPISKYSITRTYRKRIKNSVPGQSRKLEPEVCPSP